MMNLMSQGHRSLPAFVARPWALSLLCATLLYFAVSAPTQAQTADSNPQRFPIYEYQVKGNSVLTDLAIQRAVSGFTGEQKTIADVEAARLALEKTYHDAGFMTVLVTIPEQNVDAALVELQVIEANVDRLIIKGAEFTAPSVIRSRLTELTGDKPPNFNTMQDQLASLNRSNDLKVTPILKQGRLPGTVDVQLDVDDKSAVHGSFEANNKHGKDTTSSRISAGLRYDNLFQMGHSLGLTLQTAPERTDDQTVWVANYSMPLNVWGASLSGFLVNSKSKQLSGDLLTDGQTLGMRISRGLTGTDSYSHNLSAGLDYKNQRATIANQNKGPPEYVPLVVNYGATLLGKGRTTGLDLTFTNGLRGMFTNKELNFNERGQGASANFTTLKFGALHTETLSAWTLVGKLNGMLSSGILLSPEQLSMGGADTVRGYLEGERAGDQGYHGGLELQMPVLKLGAGQREWAVRGLVFVEGGRLYTLARTSSDATSHHLASVGLGMRVLTPMGMAIDADLARTLTEGGATPAHYNRLTVRAVWGY
jgi:hemolysin activation/secretion protein